jgi:hypothetical protein
VNGLFRRPPEIAVEFRVMRARSRSASLRRPPQLDVAKRDFKLANSSAVSSRRKSVGKRAHSPRTSHARGSASTCTQYKPRRVERPGTTAIPICTKRVTTGGSQQLDVCRLRASNAHAGDRLRREPIVCGGGAQRCAARPTLGNTVQHTLVQQGPGAREHATATTVPENLHGRERISGCSAERSGQSGSPEKQAPYSTARQTIHRDSTRRMNGYP